jgi:hypothetical protein
LAPVIKGDPKVNISDGERLIAVMLADIMKHLNINNEVDPAFILRALTDNDEWMIALKHPSLCGNESGPSEAVIQETHDIFGMFQSIRYATDQLPPAEQAPIRELPHFSFTGFDGNNDKHHHVASVMINELNLYPEYLGTQLNSHSQASLHRYRQMLEVYNEATENSVNFAPLTVDHLKNICS